MNKKILIFGIAVLLIIVVLSGCFEGNKNQDDTSKFIGTWILVESSFGIDNHSEETWIFYENKSAKSTSIYFMEYPEEHQSWD